ncbi:MAG: phosphoesterase [Gammaproteobacteria bacterium]
MLHHSVSVLTVSLLMLISSSLTMAQDTETAAWIAGDHHIHSRFSVGWNRDQEPPAPILAGDAIYPTPMNALMARHFGLGWMVTTDHGGPNHSQVNLETAYPELLQSRNVVPDVIQFYGMEFDTPGADHSSLIIPHTHDEAERLFSIESRFAKREPWPANMNWDTEPRMLEALRFMREFPAKPIVIANHPSRSASGEREYGADDPAELRAWNNTAPEVAVGMAGAPGHQAGTLNPDGSLDPDGARGGYGRHPTMGGFDQMTAIVGGFWDSMLAEGRNWWITANSDSHVHYSEGGSDFWPGEYSKTYVWADKNHDAILDGIRSGRIFVTTGDLISELYVNVSSSEQQARIGGDLEIESGNSVTINISFLDPDSLNHNNDNPQVERVDLIVGKIHGVADDPSMDTHAHAGVVARFTAADWITEGDYKVIQYQLENLTGDQYVRVRGTDGSELEPALDPRGEDPWSDLWFYSNPVRILVQ